MSSGFLPCPLLLRYVAFLQPVSGQEDGEREGQEQGETPSDSRVIPSRHHISEAAPDLFFIVQPEHKVLGAREAEVEKDRRAGGERGGGGERGKRIT